MTDTEALLTEADAWLDAAAGAGGEDAVETRFTDLVRRLSLDLRKVGLNARIAQQQHAEERERLRKKNHSLGCDRDIITVKLDRMEREHAATLRQALEDRVKEVTAWTETAAQYARDVDFWRGIVHQAGRHLGPAVYVSDDGSVQDTPLALKVPNLVLAVVQERDSLRGFKRGVDEALNSGDGTYRP